MSGPYSAVAGGWGGIRTHESLARLPDFKSGAFNRSATHPRGLIPPEGGRIWLELAQANGTVSVAVSDTGPGITPEERDRIFRPFWSRDGGGTGLGLAIARELAVALGGSIDLRSEPGLGSRFELQLPADAN